jgi:alpha-galactosidase/6-phospho-beta-glucosidase family protein
MNNKPRIVLTGGGSVNWTPRILNDLMLTPGLENAEYIIHDIDPSAASRIVTLGNLLKKKRGHSCSLAQTISQEEAYTGADFVIITISTGGFDAMAHDLKIPEEYGIYATVGDTVGPGGWSRAWRNVPVFEKIAKNISKYSNNAFVLNYTNPMSVLTKVFYETTSLRTVGLCHGLFEVYKTLMGIFGLKSEKEIKVRFGGVNHFFWVIDLDINGQDGYALLAEKTRGKISFSDLVRECYTDGAGFHSDKYVTAELYETFGYLPYVGDRHICEFLPYYLTSDIKRLKEYKLKRTHIEERIKGKEEKTLQLDEYINGKKNLADERSRETAADIIGSIVNGSEFIDVVNLPNSGQILNLPEGSVVETLGVVNKFGFTPVCCGKLPDPILDLVLPHAVNQNVLTKAALKRDAEKAFEALYNDPQCAHLSYKKIREMGKRLIEANKKYIPGE